MEKLLGEAQAAQLVQAIEEGRQPVSIRLNRRKLPCVSGETSFGTPVPWCTQGHYLEERLTFTFDPLFHAGVYYVQEASSMFLEQALRRYVTEPVVMLDLCAAPGGKSTLARDLLPEGSLLVANEVMHNRAPVLAENLRKWGHPDIVVTSAQPAEIGVLEGLFDVLLTDVPCSGEGMFRKDPVAVSEWSTDNVTLCERRQRDILRDVWPALKPGGLLIYSTCTYNTREDEENIDWIVRELGAEVLPLDTDPEWGITGNLSGASFPVYRFLPHRTCGEGFFLAVLRKEGGEENSVPATFAFPSKLRKQAKEKAKSKQPRRDAPAFSIHKAPYNQLPGWINGPAIEWTFSATESELCYAIRSIHTPVLEALQQAGLRILTAGVPLATQKGKDLIPHPGLALCQSLCKEVFPQAELSYEQAVTYLRRESIQLPADTPRGYVLVTYRSIPLGFVKHIGNRSNNLYPAEWRIRSSYLPEEIRTLTPPVE